MKSYKYEVPKVIKDMFGDPIGWSGKNAIYYCPHCIENVGKPDNKGHLWVHIEKLVAHCFRCGYSARIENTIGGYNLSESKLLTDEEKASLLEDALNPQEWDQGEPRFLYKIPEERPQVGTPYYDYLISRGVSEFEMQYYDIRVGSIFNKYYGRVVVPNNVEDGVLTDMFVARTIYPTEPRRYLNPPGENKSRNVFNLSRIPEDTPIIICEGVFTAISAGPQSVATYGKHVSDLQIEMILRKKPSCIYVNLDEDASKNATALARRIVKFGYSGDIYIVHNPEGKDASDLGRAGFLEYLRRAEKFEDLVEYKLKKTCEALGIQSNQ